MENNVIEKQKYNGGSKQVPDQVITAAKEYGNKAAAIAGEQLGKLAETTEQKVKRYPLAAIGIAAGCGVVLGTLGTLLFTPKPATMMDRMKDLELYGQARKLFSKYF